MITVTAQNLLEFVRSYFTSIGLEAEADSYFTAKTFTEGLVLRLPAVCLIPGNKPALSRSKQTHIHVTGNNRYFFYDEKTIDNATVSSTDISQGIIMSKQNLIALKKQTRPTGDLELISTYTMTKVACRATQETQVQISKIREDGPDFIELRRCLYENDLIVFLKYRANEKMFAVGIPHEFYEGAYEFQSDIFAGLESKGTVTVRTALDRVITDYSDTDVIDDAEAISDAVYQEMVDSAEPSTTSYVPEAYMPIYPNGKTVNSTRPSTNPAIGKEAIRDGRYKCGINAGHTTFIKKDGKPYVEVHHLIPLEWQSEFTNKLDTKANLVPVCPLCHKLLHYGRIEDITPIIARLYEERADLLKKSGIETSLEALIKFYM